MAISLQIRSTFALMKLTSCHKMTLTVSKGKFAKCKPKIVTYRDFKNFSYEAFRQEVLSNTNNCNN